MKKVILAGTLLATIGIGSLSVYAAAPATSEVVPEYGQQVGHRRNQSRTSFDRDIFTEEERQEWEDQHHLERSTHQEERIQLALSEGWITEEEAAERRDELAERDRFYEENGFSDRDYHHGRMRKAFGRSGNYRCH